MLSKALKVPTQEATSLIVAAGSWRPGHNTSSPDAISSIRKGRLVRQQLWGHLIMSPCKLPARYCIRLAAPHSVPQLEGHYERSLQPPVGCPGAATKRACAFLWDGSLYGRCCSC